jgi:hypothetical protein
VVDEEIGVSIGRRINAESYGLRSEIIATNEKADLLIEGAFAPTMKRSST